MSANTIKHLNREVDFGDDIKIDVGQITDDLRASSKKIQDENDLSELTEMLFCQTHVLQNLFVRLTSMATHQVGADNISLVVSTALKAQSQCCKTILTISELKNPKRATFIKQQTNQSLGHMQVNNKQPKHDDFLKNPENKSNELLEQNHGERLDFGTTEEAIGINQKLATMGEIHGS
jgi:hypothetical protein